MKKKLFFILCVLSLPFTSKYLAVWSIELYQNYISPHKGWKCAYSIAYPMELSCSEFGKKVIENMGTVEGVKQLWDRFDNCAISYAILSSQKKAASAGCCGSGPTAPKIVIPLLADGSKSEATLTFVYEYDWTDNIKVDWDVAKVEAAERCRGWGFSEASFFGAQITKCIKASTNPYISCERYQVIQKCQCKN
jgi:putative component of membrane protein insertase Oxa1/YidC/SpoIIIJ protein YidD